MNIKDLEINSKYLVVRYGVGYAISAYKGEGEFQDMCNGEVFNVSEIDSIKLLDSVNTGQAIDMQSAEPIIKSFKA